MSGNSIEIRPEKRPLRMANPPILQSGLEAPLRWVAAGGVRWKIPSIRRVLSVPHSRRLDHNDWQEFLRKCDTLCGRVPERDHRTYLTEFRSRTTYLGLPRKHQVCALSIPEGSFARSRCGDFPVPSTRLQKTPFR